MTGEPESFLARVLRQLSGDKSTAKPTKPAAPKRPASFYDLPEDSAGSPGAPAQDAFQSQADALRFDRPGLRPGAAVPSAMNELRDAPASLETRTPAGHEAEVPDDDDDEFDEDIDSPLDDEEAERVPRGPLAPIPPKLATLGQQGGKLVIAYAPLRTLGLGLALFLVGLLISGVGILAVIGNPQNWTVALAMVSVGLVLGMIGAHLLVSNLHVTAGGGQLNVVKRGLFGTRQLQAAANTIIRIEPVLSYTVSGGNKSTNYYTVTAHTVDGAKLPVGYGIPGPELGNSIAYRVADALHLPEVVVTPLHFHHYESS